MIKLLPVWPPVVCVQNKKKKKWRLGGLPEWNMTEQIQASEPGWLTLLGILSARNSIKLLIIGTAWKSVFITAGQSLPLEPSQRQKKRLMAQSRLIYWLFWMKYGRIGRRPLPPATIDFHSVFRLSAPLCKMPPSYFILFLFFFHSQLPLWPLFTQRLGRFAAVQA